VLTIQGLSVAEVAQALPSSKGWVSMRRRLLDELSPAIQAVLFRGTLTHSAAHPWSRCMVADWWRTPSRIPVKKK
jgi:hypothetical protein